MRGRLRLSARKATTSVLKAVQDLWQGCPQIFGIWHTSQRDHVSVKQQQLLHRLAALQYTNIDEEEEGEETRIGQACAGRGHQFTADVLRRTKASRSPTKEKRKKNLATENLDRRLCNRHQGRLGDVFFDANEFVQRLFPRKHGTCCQLPRL